MSDARADGGRKIAVITGTRAEYGLLYWTMRELQARRVGLDLVVTGAHLSKDHGYTVEQIEKDGFSIAARVDMKLENDDRLSTVRSMTLCMQGVAEALASMKPDMVVILGDRYEMLAAASAAAMLQIPIGHIHGGEVTEGAIDESIRHAITKLSYWHFATAEPYAARIRQMGENPEHVFHVGAPGIDNIARLPLLSRMDLENELGMALTSPLLLCTYHPETLGACPVETQVDAMLAALEQFSAATLVITGANADTGGNAINHRLEKFARARARTLFRPSFGSLLYLSLMKEASAVVGNSSSGMIEAPVLGRATVNIGDRQKGRIRSPGVIDCRGNSQDIIDAIHRAISPQFQKELRASLTFGEPGKVAPAIADLLTRLPIPARPLKPFYDI